MYPGVIVRVTPQEGPGESFVVSNEAGVQLMPLRPGDYCFQAYDRKGKQLRLAPQQPNCFSVAKGKTTDVGIVILGE